jgi:hypothetical protein
MCFKTLALLAFLSFSNKHRHFFEYLLTVMVEYLYTFCKLFLIFERICYDVNKIVFWLSVKIRTFIQNRKENKTK